MFKPVKLWHPCNVLLNRVGVSSLVCNIKVDGHLRPAELRACTERVQKRILPVVWIGVAVKLHDMLVRHPVYKIPRKFLLDIATHPIRHVQIGLGAERHRHKLAGEHPAVLDIISSVVLAATGTSNDKAELRRLYLIHLHRHLLGNRRVSVVIFKRKIYLMLLSILLFGTIPFRREVIVVWILDVARSY